MYQPRWYPTPRRVDVPTPAVASGFSRLNDSGGWWIVRSIAWRLVTDANAANRFVAITATAGEDLWFASTSQVAHAATLTRDYSAWAGASHTTVDTAVIVTGLPSEGLWMPPGHVLATSIAGVQAGDQMSRIFLSVIELPEALPSSLMPMIPTFTTEDGV